MPFGEELTPDGTYRKTNDKYTFGDNIRQKFTGYERDEETELDYAQARYYNSKHGRFTAVDPLLASGKSADPQTFNRYIYVSNNPIVFTDPTGLIGDYYDRNGNFLVSDGKKDDKVYFADYSHTDINGNVYGTNVVETTSEAVQNAQSGGSFSQRSWNTPHQPGDVRDNFREFIDSTNAALDQKIPVVAGVAATGVVIGTGVGVAVYAAGATGAGITTLGVAGAESTASTTAGVATVNSTTIGNKLHFSVNVARGGQNVTTQLRFTADKATSILRANPNKGFLQSQVNLPNAERAIRFQNSLLQRGTVGQYSTYTNSCLTHVCGVLRAGGLSRTRTAIEGSKIYVKSQLRRIF